MTQHLKISIVIASALLLSGCASWFRPDEPPTIIYRTQYQAVTIPDSYFDDCPRYINPPAQVQDGIDDEADQIALGDWLNINEQRYGECEQALRDVEAEQEAIIQTVEQLNERLRNLETESKDD